MLYPGISPQAKQKEVHDQLATEEGFSCSSPSSYPVLPCYFLLGEMLGKLGVAYDWLLEPSPDVSVPAYLLFL
jgi:hypothetical protein